MQINYVLFFLKKKKKANNLACITRQKQSRIKEVHRGMFVYLYRLFFLVQLGIGEASENLEYRKSDRCRQSTEK